MTQKNAKLSRRNFLLSVGAGGAATVITSYSIHYTKLYDTAVGTISPRSLKASTSKVAGLPASESCGRWRSAANVGHLDLARGGGLGRASYNFV